MQLMTLGVEVLGFAVTVGTIVFYGGKVVGRVEVEKDLGELKKTIDSIRADLTTHSVDIGKLQAQYGQTNSPVVPSPEGQKLLDESGFSQIYPQIKSRVFEIMDSLNPRTLYDYERGAYAALLQMKDDTAMDILKTYAVNHPDQPLELILAIAAWVVRDDYAVHKPPNTAQPSVK